MSSPKPSRPNPNHHDSFFRKLHKRHDERHHPHETRHRDEEQQPLLREEHPDSASEIEAHAEESAEEPAPETFSHPPPVLSKVHRFVQKLRSVVSGGINTTRNAIRRNPKRTVGGALGVLLMLVVGEAGDIFMHHHYPPTDNIICMTPTCIAAASSILNNLHPKFEHMDPCENFEQFVCGGFRLNHELRDGQGSMSTDSLLEDEMYTTLRRVLESQENEVKEEDKSIFKKVKDDYLACMDEEKLKEYGAKPLKGVIDEIRSHFHVQKNTLRKSLAAQFALSVGNNAPITFTEPFIQMATLGVEALISFKIEADTDDPGIQTVVATSVVPIGLPSKEHYKDKDLLAEYTQSIEKSIAHFYDIPANSSMKSGRLGSNMPTTHIAAGIVQLESNLAKIVPSDLAMISGSKQIKITFDEFEEHFPHLSVRSVIKKLGPSNYSGNTILVPSIKYLQALSRTISDTPQEIIHAFMIWKAIQAYADFVETKILSDWKILAMSLSGAKLHAHEDRWRTCARSVNNDFGWIMSRFYVKRQFSKEGKDVGDQVIAEIKKAFSQTISKTSWMTEDERKKAVSKLDRTVSKLGYPSSEPNIQDPGSLDSFYSNVMVQNNTYLENKVQSIRARILRHWSKLGQPTNSHEWPISATTIDTYYDVSLNEIVIPAAVMRKPLLYSLEAPSYLTHGAFGAIIGQELTHAFDNAGVTRDENGIVKHWWSNSTEVAFAEKSNCFIKQYSQYDGEGPVAKLSINGNLTVNEAIADAGGLHSAYIAWSQSESQNPSKRLPGLMMFNQQQLFWLSYGNRWCSKATEKALEQQFLIEPYLPPSIRIKGSVANSREFREAFNCPAKEPVCTLW